MDDYEQQILTNWEDVYKRGLLTLWILMALLDGQKRMLDIKKFISTHTGNISADDKSMYRALRRYYDTELVEYSNHPGKGPDIKVYRLTKTGKKILKAFLTRNIINTYYSNDIKELITKGIK